MSFVDWLFPEQAGATHLRRIANQQRQYFRSQVNANHTSLSNTQQIQRLAQEVAELQSDLGLVALMLTGILRALEVQGSVDRADVYRWMEELDVADGRRDGQLDIKALRRAREKVCEKCDRAFTPRMSHQDVCEFCQTYGPK